MARTTEGTGTGGEDDGRGSLGVIPELSTLLGALFLLGNYLVSESKAFALDVGLILSGIPAYYMWLRYR